MGNTIGHNRNLSSDRQRQAEGQEVRDQSQRPEYRRPTHQDFTYNPPRSSQYRVEQPAQDTPQEGQERRILRRTQRMQDLISPLATEQYSRTRAGHDGRSTNQEHEEKSDREEPEIIKDWRDQQVDDLHSKLNPTDKPDSSNSEEEKSILFVEKMNMRMIVYERQKESLLDKYYALGEDTNRDQEMESMMQLHDQNREELVKILLEERSKSGNILGIVPGRRIREELENKIDEKIQEYINKKDE